MTFAEIRSKVWALIVEYWHVLAWFAGGYVLGKGWLGRLL